MFTALFADPERISDVRDPYLREGSPQQVHALLLTRGRFNYARDLQSILALPPGGRYYVQWGEEWSGPPDRLKGLNGKRVVYCLFVDETLEVVPLRVVTVRDVDHTPFSNLSEIDGSDLRLSKGFLRAELEVGGWAVDRAGQPMLWKADTDTASPDDLGWKITLDRALVPEQFIVHLDEPHELRERLDIAPWAAIVRLLKDRRDFRDAVFLTVTSVKLLTLDRLILARVRDSRLIRSWQTHPVRSLRWRVANLASAGATRVRGRYVIRSGNTYRVRLIYFARKTGGTQQTFGILNRDPVVTPVSPAQDLLPGEFEIMDLPFTARVTRRRLGTVVLGPAETQASDAPVPLLPLSVDLRPRRSFRVIAGGAALVAIAALVAASLREKLGVPNYAQDGLVVLGTTIFAALVAYGLRPED